MARTKSGREPSTLRKTGHNLTGSAVELLRTLADLLRVDEGILLEVGIRGIFDKLPSGQKEAVSVILRAKGGNLRELRKVNNSGTETGEGEGTSIEPLHERTREIDRIHIRSTSPVDAALESMN
jgi:hypothetical protein